MDRRDFLYKTAFASTVGFGSASVFAPKADAFVWGFFARPFIVFLARGAARKFYQRTISTSVKRLTTKSLRRPMQRRIVRASNNLIEDGFTDVAGETAGAIFDDWLARENEKQRNDTQIAILEHLGRVDKNRYRSAYCSEFSGLNRSVLFESPEIILISKVSRDLANRGYSHAEISNMIYPRATIANRSEFSYRKGHIIPTTYETGAGRFGIKCVVAEDQQSATVSGYFNKLGDPSDVFEKWEWSSESRSDNLFDDTTI